MTKKEMAQLHCLNIEIEQDKKKLEELENNVYPSVNYSNSGGSCGEISDKTGNLAILIYEQKRLIENKLERICLERTRLYRFVLSVDDSLMRQILTLRYVNNLTWQQIATATNNYDESTLRKLHNRFLQKMSENSASPVL